MDNKRLDCTSKHLRDMNCIEAPEKKPAISRPRSFVFQTALAKRTDRRKVHPSIGVKLATSTRK